MSRQMTLRESIRPPSRYDEEDIAAPVRRPQQKKKGPKTTGEQKKGEKKKGAKSRGAKKNGATKKVATTKVDKKKVATPALPEVPVPPNMSSNPQQRPAAFPSLPLTGLPATMNMPFNPQQRPAAFPSLPLTGPYDIPEQEDHDAIDIASDEEIVADESNSVNGENAQPAPDGGSPTFSEVMNDMFDEPQSQPFEVIEWSMIDIAYCYRIFDALSKATNTTKAAELLRLSAYDHRTMMNVLAWRRQYPFTLTQTNDTNLGMNACIDPVVMMNNFDLLQKADDIEMGSPNTLFLAQRFLAQHGFPPGLLGNWVEDPLGSGKLINTNPCTQTIPFAELSLQQIQDMRNSTFRTPLAQVPTGQPASGSGSVQLDDGSEMATQTRRVAKPDRLVHKEALPTPDSPDTIVVRSGPPLFEPRNGADPREPEHNGRLKTKPAPPQLSDPADISGLGAVSRSTTPKKKIITLKYDKKGTAYIESSSPVRSSSPPPRADNVDISEDQAREEPRHSNGMEDDRAYPRVISSSEGSSITGVITIRERDFATARGWEDFKNRVAAADSTFEVQEDAAVPGTSAIDEERDTFHTPQPSFLPPFARLADAISTSPADADDDQNNLPESPLAGRGSGVSRRILMPADGEDAEMNDIASSNDKADKVLPSIENDMDMIEQSVATNSNPLPSVEHDTDTIEQPAATTSDPLLELIQILTAAQLGSKADSHAVEDGGRSPERPRSISPISFNGDGREQLTRSQRKSKSCVAQDQEGAVDLSQWTASVPNKAAASPTSKAAPETKEKPSLVVVLKMRRPDRTASATRPSSSVEPPPLVLGVNFNDPGEEGDSSWAEDKPTKKKQKKSTTSPKTKHQQIAKPVKELGEKPASSPKKAETPKKAGPAPVADEDTAPDKPRKRARGRPAKKAAPKPEVEPAVEAGAVLNTEDLAPLGDDHVEGTAQPEEDSSQAAKKEDANGTPAMATMTEEYTDQGQNKPSATVTDSKQPMEGQTTNPVPAAMAKHFGKRAQTTTSPAKTRAKAQTPAPVAGTGPKKVSKKKAAQDLDEPAEALPPAKKQVVTGKKAVSAEVQRKKQASTKPKGNKRTTHGSASAVQALVDEEPPSSFSNVVTSRRMTRSQTPIIEGAVEEQAAPSVNMVILPGKGAVHRSLKRSNSQATQTATPDPTPEPSEQTPQMLPPKPSTGNGPLQWKPHAPSAPAAASHRPMTRSKTPVVQALIDESREGSVASAGSGEYTASEADESEASVGQSDKKAVKKWHRKEYEKTRGSRRINGEEPDNEGR